jgi:hypothetical protein
MKLMHQQVMVIFTVLFGCMLMYLVTVWGQMHGFGWHCSSVCAVVLISPSPPVYMLIAKLLLLDLTPERLPCEVHIMVRTPLHSTTKLLGF